MKIFRLVLIIGLIGMALYLLRKIDYHRLQVERQGARVDSLEKIGNRKLDSLRISDSLQVVTK